MLLEGIFHGLMVLLIFLLKKYEIIVIDTFKLVFATSMKFPALSHCILPALHYSFTVLILVL